MNMPGFNADASLYGTSEYYQMTQAFRPCGNGILPAFTPGPEGPDIPIPGLPGRPTIPPPRCYRYCDWTCFILGGRLRCFPFCRWVCF